MKGAPDINLYLRQNPRDGKHGAPMGHSNRDEGSPGLRRYCQRVRFVDGDYSADGTYWGSGGGRLYAVFTFDMLTLCFYRAATRNDALRAHWNDYPY